LLKHPGARADTHPDMPGTHGRRPATTRALAVTLGSFTGAALEAMARRQSLSPQELVSLAAEYYIADENAGRQAARMPRWLDELDDRGGVTLEVEVGTETWDVLQARAREERTSPEALLEHATLQLIADLDSGRVQARVARDD
jgi:hypothetical protein